MSFETNVQSLATRIATECKSLRTLINGNAADLAGLTTTAKSNLVAAINELDAAIDNLAANPTISSLDDLSDVVVATAAVGQMLRYNGTNWVNTDPTTYLQPRDTDLDNIAALTTTAFGRSFLELANATALTGLVESASATARGVVELATDAEASTGTDTTRAVTPANMKSVLDARFASLVNSAPGLLDTLGEIADALGDDPNFAATMTTALNNRVRVDTATQGLTALQQSNARTNIDVYSKAEIGNVNADFVATFNAGLV